MFARFSHRLFLAAALVATAAAPALAQAPAAAPAGPLTVEDIWKSPSLSNITISRDGKYMAATAPMRGRMNLVVIPLEGTGAVALTGLEDYDVVNVRWVGSSRLVYSLGQANTPTGAGQGDGGGLYMVSRDGKDRRRISGTVREVLSEGRFVYRRYGYFRGIPGSEEEIIASGNMSSVDSTDLYRLNVVTGRATLMTSGRPSELARSWILDKNLVPRVLTAGVKDKLTQVVWYRKDADSPWVEIARFEANKGPAFVPLGFESDQKTLKVATNAGRDTMAIFRFDPEQKKLGELIAQHPRFDMGANAQGEPVPGVVTDPETDRILGYTVEAAKPEVVWLDDKRRALQASLDAFMPGRINRFSRTPDGKRWLVTSYSDQHPARWYLFDDEKKTIQEIGAARPWLDGKLVEQRPFLFNTRDGLEIPGYYFLPKDWKPGTKLPTVVHIHGGPFARADTFGNGFGYSEAQLFASRGYAVIVPNFRITPGLGGRIYYGGFGTYGRQMVDDHEDALKWGIAQGFVDPARVCASGASYGGYAALQLLARDNGMWKCAVSGLAVTDLKYQLTTTSGDTAGNEAGVNYWKSVLGIEDLSSPLVREISPVHLASRIKRPVFLYAGRDDIRVPIAQIEEMASNLEAAGNAPKAFVVKDKEGHGFGRLENRVDTWNAILEFLQKHL